MPDQPAINMSGPFFAIANITTGRIIYSGKSATSMATRLAPGTCWGRGWSTERAVKQAAEWRDWFAGKERGEA